MHTTTRPKRSVEECIAAARRDAARRAARATALDPDYFGEAGWNILLDLYLSTAEGRPSVPTTNLMIASLAPETTALRYIGLLAKAGEVERRSCSRDRRVVLIALTVEGRERLEQALSAMIEAEERIVSPHRAALWCTASP